VKQHLIDSHCHVDLYHNPFTIAQAAERAKILTVAVTYLPSHYIQAKLHLQGFKHVRPALGLHPQVADQHEREIQEFIEQAKDASYIGEIGLDFSKEYLPTKDLQERSFAQVIATIKDRQRFVTLHSRGAELAVLRQLNAAQMYPVVFHWFSGNQTQLSQVLDAGHYLSFNTKMVGAARWEEDILRIPKERVLTETDGPFVREGKRIAEPQDTQIVIRWLARAWSVSIEEAMHQVASNFSALPK
jgi:TatD DNase family protein